jgi:hypothetical protein
VLHTRRYFKVGLRWRVSRLTSSVSGCPAPRAPAPAYRRPVSALSALCSRCVSTRDAYQFNSNATTSMPRQQITPLPRLIPTRPIGASEVGRVGISRVTRWTRSARGSVHAVMRGTTVATSPLPPAFAADRELSGDGCTLIEMDRVWVSRRHVYQQQARKPPPVTPHGSTHKGPAALPKCTRTPRRASIRWRDPGGLARPR